MAKTFGIAAGPIARTPNVARAGKRFAIGYEVLRTDWPFPAESATVTCVATLGGKRIAARRAFAGGLAACSVTLPKTVRARSCASC
ncbi:MAG: hypothetical protein WD689_04460 [Gaiellaceae bacterium]